MRWAIGFLIVINVAIFLWGRLVQEPITSRPEGRAASPVPSLQLLSDETAPGEAPDDRVLLPPPADSPVTALAEPDPTEQTNADAVAALGPEDTAAPATGAETSDPAGPAPADAGPPEETARADAEDQGDAGRGADGDPLEEETRYCGLVGPITKLPQAEAAKERLLEAGVESSLQEVVESETKGFWVLIPPLADRAEGNRMVSRLRGKGVKDMWLFTRGELDNAISLGLYNRRKNAEIRQEQLKSLGFETEVRPRLEHRTSYQLSLSAAEPEAIERVSELLPRLDSRSSSCAEAVAATDAPNEL